MDYTKTDAFREIAEIFRNDGAFEGPSKDSINDPKVIKLAQTYAIKLLGEIEPQMMWGRDADNYYFQMSTHCFNAGLCVAKWLNDGTFREKSALQAILSNDSILIARTTVPVKNEEKLDSITNIRYDQFLEYMGSDWEPELDNTDDRIVAAMVAFFLAGATEDLKAYHLDSRKM